MNTTKIAENIISSITKRADESFTTTIEKKYIEITGDFLKYTGVDVSTLKQRKEGYDYEVNWLMTNRINVSWSLQFEMRDWGIKEMYISMKEVKGTLYGTLELDYDDVTAEWKRHEPFEISIENLSKTFQINSEEFEAIKKMPISPTEIEIDFDEKLIYVR